MGRWFKLRLGIVLVAVILLAYGYFEALDLISRLWEISNSFEEGKYAIALGQFEYGALVVSTVASTLLLLKVLPKD